MNESTFWRKVVRPALLPFGVLHRIENVTETGTPDVTYSLRRDRNVGPGRSGWIELKYVPAWPARPGGILKFRKFTTDQADWLVEWRKVGGRACVLTRVGDDCFLMDGLLARELRDGMTRQEIRERCAVYAEGVFPTGRILKWLTEPRT